MKRPILLYGLFIIYSFAAKAQDMSKAAAIFITSLDSAQKVLALYPFDIDERYSFHYFPIENRKGVPFDALNNSQRKYAFMLLETGLSKGAIQKTEDIRGLEIILKELEQRKADDHYRDSGKYHIAIFGLPGDHTIWGWRFEGHHVSFTFTVSENKIVSGTPGFLGANPAIVQQGPQKGIQVLREETDMGFDLLHALSSPQLQKAIISTKAPGDILTYINRKAMIEHLAGIRYDELTDNQKQLLLQIVGLNRKAMIEHPAGIRYDELTDNQKQLLLQIVGLYVHRYTRLFAEQMLKEIQQAGLNEIRFAWAGDREKGVGHPCYYRIQGPSFIIEYDNTQDNANHVHTVFRDLKNDFGGDMLLEHYRTSH
jgi:hypothetical protein